jgi:hypothetical protein
MRRHREAAGKGVMDIGSTSIDRRIAAAQRRARR